MQAESEVLSRDAQTSSVKLRIVASAIPATGYRTFIVKPRPTTSKFEAAPIVVATSSSIENNILKVTIDPATGCITSLYDKINRIEALAPAIPGVGAPPNLPDGKPCGNLLQAFVDKPKQWDAWNVDADFIEHHTDILKADEVKLIESSPIHAVVRVKHTWQNSSFIQDITLNAYSPRVDVHMQAEWHEKHILLKVAFPLSARSDKATFEIPYGTVSARRRATLLPRKHSSRSQRYAGPTCRTQPTASACSTTRNTATTPRTTSCASRFCAGLSIPTRTPTRAITNSPTRCIRTREHGARR